MLNHEYNLTWVTNANRMQVSNMQSYDYKRKCMFKTTSPLKDLKLSTKWNRWRKKLDIYSFHSGQIFCTLVTLLSSEILLDWLEKSQFDVSTELAERQTRQGQIKIRFLFAKVILRRKRRRRRRQAGDARSLRRDSLIGCLRSRNWPWPIKSPDFRAL